MARVEINPDWRGPVTEAWRQFAKERLGPEVAGDARKLAPVETGALRDSIEHTMEGDDLIVSAVGGAGGRAYAVYVELGHRVYHPSTGVTGPEVVPAEPFLRPALFKHRGE